MKIGAKVVEVVDVVEVVEVVDGELGGTVVVTVVGGSITHGSSEESIGTSPIRAIGRTAIIDERPAPARLAPARSHMINATPANTTRAATVMVSARPPVSGNAQISDGTGTPFEW